MYFYHGYALGVGSTVKDKQFTEAVSALSVRGGIATANSTFNNYGITFNAQSTVSGTADERNGVYVWVTNASVVISNLTILGRITADRIEGHVISEFRPGDYEANTVITGSSFTNLKIDGNPVQVNLSNDMFGRYLTFGSMESDFDDTFTQPRLLECLVGRDLPGAGGTSNDLRAAYDAYQEQKALPTLRSAVICSLVKKVTCGGLKAWGPIIEVPNLGNLYLGEVIAWPWMRCLTMFRLELLDSDGKSAGSISGGSAGANGTTFPPGAYGGGGDYGGGGG